MLAGARCVKVGSSCILPRALLRASASASSPDRAPRPAFPAPASVGAAEGIKNTRPSQAEIYAKAGVELKDGKPSAPGDAAAAEDKVGLQHLRSPARWLGQPLLRCAPPLSAAGLPPPRLASADPPRPPFPAHHHRISQLAAFPLTPCIARAGPRFTASLAARGGCSSCRQRYIAPWVECASPWR